MIARRAVLQSVLLNAAVPLIGYALLRPRPDAVSWAPRSVPVRLSKPVAGGDHVQLRLRTRATDGCYGVLIGSAPDSRYAAVVDGRTKRAPRVQMLWFS
jgi:hypothetical protein